MEAREEGAMCGSSDLFPTSSSFPQLPVIPSAINPSMGQSIDEVRTPMI